MSLYKAIECNKEHRKPYRGSKAIDCICKIIGTVVDVNKIENIRIRKREESAESELKEYEREIDFIIPKQIIPVNLKITNIRKHGSVIDDIE